MLTITTHTTADRAATVARAVTRATQWYARTEDRLWERWEHNEQAAEHARNAGMLSVQAQRILLAAQAKDKLIAWYAAAC